MPTATTTADPARAGARARVAIAALSLLAVLAAGLGVAGAEEGPEPAPGTSVTVDLAEIPTPPPVFEGAELTVSGTASVVGTAPVPDTSLVFVVDTSGSTADPIDCDGDPATEPISILTCQADAIDAVVPERLGDDIANVGVASFPGSFRQQLVVPGDFTSDAIRGITPGGGTPFGAGLAGALDVLSGPEARTGSIIVVLTDGDGELAPLSEAQRIELGHASILAFAFAGASSSACSSGAALAQVTALGDPASSSCQVVDDLASLPSAIGDSLPPEPTLADVTITVSPQDGGETMATGPAALDGSGGFSATFAAPPAGDYDVCATATATDGASATDCEPLTTIAETIDCGDVPGTCTTQVTDDLGNTLTFTAPAGFDKPVGISPAERFAAECGTDTACRAAFDVRFDDTGPRDQVVEIRVVTPNRVPLREALNAAAFIDGQRITSWCGGPLLERLRRLLNLPEPQLPCADIRYVSGFRLQYTVKFAADPTFRFR